MITNLEGLYVSPNDSLRVAIETIGINRNKFVLVLNNEDKLLGSITDGDIRRALLAGFNLDSLSSEIMNRNPVFVQEQTHVSHILEIMSETGIRHMPVISSEKRVIGLITFDEMLIPERISTPVILMAGGKGQRLYPLTKDVPKPMLPVGDTPILGIILEKLKTQGFNDVRISVNYLKEIIIDYVGDGREFGLNVTYLHEDQPLGTAGALASVKQSLNEAFIVMNSDLLTQVDLRELLRFHHRNNAQATIGVREHVIQIPFGVVDVEGTSVVSLSEKPLHRSLVSAGIYALEPESISTLNVNEYCDMPTLLGNLMGQNKKISAYTIHESWLDVGRPEDLNKARQEAITED